MQVQESHPTQHRVRVAQGASIRPPVKVDDAADLFSLYVSNEPGTRMQFTNAAFNAGRTSTSTHIATSCCLVV